MLGAAVAWRVASEVEEERRRLDDETLEERRARQQDAVRRREAVRRRAASAPIVITRPDGSRDEVPALGEMASPPLEIEDLAVVGQPATGHPVEDRRDVHVPRAPEAGRVHGGARSGPVRAAALLAVSLLGLSGTFWALTNPLVVAAWPAALLGLAAVALSWSYAHRSSRGA